MKLTFVIKYLEGVSGGAERVLRDVTSGLADLGHAVEVVSFDRQQAQAFYPFHPSVTWTKLGASHGQAKQLRGAAHLLMSLGEWLRLRGKLQADKPDAVVGFMSSAFVPLAFTSLGAGLRLFASEHNHYQNYNSAIKRLALRLSAPRFVRITALSEAIRQSFPKAVATRMRVVPNPVERPETLAQDVGKEAGPKLCLSVGRMTEQKDQATLIRAFAALVPDFPDWRLRILGDGPLRQDLQALVEQLELAERIDLDLPIPDIEQAYWAAQLFVLSSRYEGFGLVTAEAIAHGLPAVGFADCPGTNEIIVHGQNGILAPAIAGQDRAEALAFALRPLFASVTARVALVAPDVGLHDSREVAKLWQSMLVSTDTA